MSRALPFLVAMCLLRTTPGLAIEPAAALAAVDAALARHVATLPGRATVEVAPLANPSLLPACSSVEATLPAGARPWGRTHVSLRCTSGANWTMNVQVTIRVQAEYLVTARAVSPGRALGPEDIALRSGDLADLPDDVLTDRAAAEGRLSRMAIAGGLPLRAVHLRTAPVIRSGQSVQVISRGAGFEVANQGTALNGAAAGEIVRVRLATGAVVSGNADPHGRVEVRR